mmetsp:Transcript_24440/g.29855  ORF Transcript_24440/g.29855 Transcript_24440/m.29855 type:complete len:491 (-) Transcript_24440:134-1606(-)|eukprot:CAMPEP_0204826866 /NCGR_PEP_ID=MMETSP1346-20131115/4474_1 /ASSEMBLY_ACC=CAM_ASM_000771 /TAXON_ID=215587 /ORGANISM="Aplanochytrium stocchinoi, Strain GSBS06" /LENGTH=490 /DNA_ID=CAMNT_0051955081 /DNA_START=234 /DNA_END=1706 /DNA_ORIENTATION=-
MRIKTALRLCLLALFLFLFLVVEKACGKVVSGRAYTTPGRINEITKFNFGIGKGTIEGTLEYQGNPNGKIYFFMDTKWWDEFHTSDSCEKVKSAHAYFDIGAVGERINYGLGKAFGSDPEPSETNKRKTIWRFSWNVQHHVRTYGWYVVIADCSHMERGEELPKKGKRNKYAKSRYKVNYDLTLMNGDSHLSRDEAWIGEFYFLILLILVGVGYKLKEDQKKSSMGGKKHLIVKLLFAAYILQIVSIVFELIHQVLYNRNGYGIWFFDFLSELIEGFGQNLISYILISLANGWTLSAKTTSTTTRGGEASISDVLRNPSLMDLDNPLMFLLMLFGVVTTILQIVNKVYDDSFMKFHDHETTAGFFLLVIRTGLGFSFVYSFFHTIKAEEKRGSSKLTSFMKTLAIFGGIWFLAFPFTVMFASFWAHYLRHFVVTVGVLLTQSVCLISLMYQFSSTKSTYAKFSEASSMGMLPIGGFGGGGGYPVTASKFQ